MAEIDHFLRACADEIGRRALIVESGRVEVAEGSRRFSDAVDTATPLTGDLTDLPVTDSLDRLSSSPLVTSLLAARDELRWIPSPRTSDHGVDRALAPLNDVCNLGALTCGLMLLAAGADYPQHAHRPHEIYLPISGNRRWRYGGDATYRTLADDALVYNPPRALHGTCAGDDPLIALYVLWA